MSHCYTLALRKLAWEPPGRARDIENGMKGFASFLNYVTTNFAYSFGQYWDRAEIFAPRSRPISR